MLKKTLLQDLIRLWVLLTACFVVGVILNEMRPNPLDLVYASPQVRLGQSVKKLAEKAPAAIASEGDVSCNELGKLVANRAALILDARPEVFYRISHIPTALSLPRDDFEARYPKLKSTLEADRGQPFVVYCSSTGCEDSRMVADALRQLGYAHVHLFRGGWYDWIGANLPQETER